jgi:hypothetical protein
VRLPRAAGNNSACSSRLGRRVGLVRWQPNAGRGFRDDWLLHRVLGRDPVKCRRVDTIRAAYVKGPAVANG